MNKLKYYTIGGIIFVLITGTLSHFLYEWTSFHYLIGLIAPVNESTWEHMKLLFFPMLLYALFMLRIRTGYPGILSALPSGILLGTISIPIIFYTYTGIWGTHFFVGDILTFILSVLIGFRSVYRLTLSCKAKGYTVLLWVLVCVLLIGFLIFSYRPPEIGLFAEP